MCVLEKAMLARDPRRQRKSSLPTLGLVRASSLYISQHLLLPKAATSAVSTLQDRYKFAVCVYNVRREIL